MVDNGLTGKVSPVAPDTGTPLDPVAMETANVRHAQLTRLSGDLRVLAKTVADYSDMVADESAMPQISAWAQAIRDGRR